MNPVRLITHAVDWLHHHAGEVLGGGTLIDYQHPAPPTQTPMLEIPLLCRALRAPDVSAQLSPGTRQQRDNLIIRVAGPDPGDRQRLADQATYPYQLVRIGLLAGCGIDIDEPETHQALITLGHGGITSQTRPPSAVLELRWAQRLVGCAGADGDSDADLYRRDVLAHDLDLARTTDYDAYIATHLIFYLTDVGRSPWPAELGGERGRAAAWIGHLLALHLCRSHWDLVAELLLCWRALGLGDTPLTGYAWEELENSQDPTGVIPGPWWRDAESAPETSYHTTLVAALSASVWLTAPAVSPVFARRRPPRSAVVDDAWWTAVDALVSGGDWGFGGPVRGVKVGPRVLRASRDFVLAMCHQSDRQQPPVTGRLPVEPLPEDGWGGEYLAVRGIHALREHDLLLADACLGAAIASTGLTAVTRSGAEDLICRSGTDPAGPRPTRTLQALADLRSATGPSTSSDTDATERERRNPASSLTGAG